MTKGEAIQAMKSGKKVTHRYYDPAEWSTMQGNKIVFEDGCKLWAEDFWKDRTSPGWLFDWSLFDTEKP